MLGLNNQNQNKILIAMNRIVLPKRQMNFVVTKSTGSDKKYFITF